MEKEKVTLSMDKQLMTEVRVYCAEHGNMQYSSFIEQAIKDKLKKK